MIVLDVSCAGAAKFQDHGLQFAVWGTQPGCGQSYEGNSPTLQDNSLVYEIFI